MTNYGKKVYDIIRKYQSVARFYDEMTGLAIFSLEEYNSDEFLKEEVFQLLQEENFIDDNKVEHNFALEIKPAWDNNIDDINPEMVVIRDVESYC